jgi:DNA-binding NarL/FixJ family response regulator
MEQNIFLNFPFMHPDQKIKVIIADDQALFLEGLRMMLSQFPFLTITGEASNGEEVLDLVLKDKPDVIITDIQMPVMDGVELTRELHKCYPEIKIIALTAFGEDHYIVDMLEAGARGYLMKNSKKEKLAEAILSVLTNGTYYCESTSSKLFQKFSAGHARVKMSAEELGLTELEQQIVRLICEQLSSKEIADKLCVGLKTVEGYRNKIYDKLGVKNMAGLALYAYKSGLYRE